MIFIKKISNIYSCILNKCYFFYFKKKSKFCRTNVWKSIYNKNYLWYSNKPKEGDSIKIYKGYIIRLYPNKEQEQTINKTFKATRFIYNYFLEQKINTHQKTKKTSTYYQETKKLPEIIKQHPWLNEIDKEILKNSLYTLNITFNNQKLTQQYPKFKIKNHHERYRINTNIKLDQKNHIINISKLDNIKIGKYKKQILGNIRHAVIKKEAGKYYISLLVEQQITIPPFIPNFIIGLDLGIKNLIVTSHNEKIENTIKINTKRLKGLQKALSRCQYRSKNREKIKLKIQKLYQKIKNARKNLIHTITNKLISENDIIVTENLDVKSMQKNHFIAKGLNENPISEIIKVLKYKAIWNNKKLIQINRYYPSSQICSVCNYQNRNIKDLTIRKWECPKCHTYHDRDFNASVNIMFEGLKIYMRSI